jgi:hypothetical protein
MESPYPSRLFGGIAAAGAAAVPVAFLTGYLATVVVVTLEAKRFSFESLLGPAFAVGFICALVAVPASLAICVVFGVPIFRLWVRLGRRSLPDFLLAGSVISLASIGCLLVPHLIWATPDWPQLFLALLPMAIAGPVGGAIVHSVAYGPRARTSVSPSNYRLERP